MTACRCGGTRASAAKRLLTSSSLASISSSVILRTSGGGGGLRGVHDRGAAAATFALYEAEQ